MSTVSWRHRFMLVSSHDGTIRLHFRFLDGQLGDFGLYQRQRQKATVDVAFNPWEANLRFIIPTLCLGLLAAASPALAQSAQSRHCSSEASERHLTGKARTSFRAACLKGPLSPKTSTAPTGPGKEAHAVTAPSGADRTVRSKQCEAEADKRGLQAKDRKQFQLSCLATAGPVSEGETHDQPPKPAKAIPGIGVNNNQPPH